MNVNNSYTRSSRGEQRARARLAKTPTVLFFFFLAFFLLRETQLLRRRGPAVHHSPSSPNVFAPLSPTALSHRTCLSLRLSVTHHPRFLRMRTFLYVTATLARRLIARADNPRSRQNELICESGRRRSRELGQRATPSASRKSISIPSRNFAGTSACVRVCSVRAVIVRGASSSVISRDFSTAPSGNYVILAD